MIAFGVYLPVWKFDKDCFYPGVARDEFLSFQICIKIGFSSRSQISGSGEDILHNHTLYMRVAKEKDIRLGRLKYEKFLTVHILYGNEEQGNSGYDKY